MKNGPLKTLDKLRETQGPVSGVTLAEVLGVSRAQVHNYVKSLRTEGYEIPGDAGSGYSLSTIPDRLFPQEIQHNLRTQWLAQSYRHYEEIDSTNSEAFRWAEQGAPHGATVAAEAQTAGRGRRGRAFFSPARSNLYTSIVLRTSMEVQFLPTLMLSAGVAVADAICQETHNPDRIEIKWPNDVLVDGLKVSGILPESKVDDNHVVFVVLGIGVNLNTPRNSMPVEFRDRATSLATSLGRPIERLAFTKTLYSHLEAIIERHLVGGFPAVRSDYERYFHMHGKDVQITDFDGTVAEGKVRGVAETGALLLTTVSGETKEFFAGDVTLRPPRPESITA